MRTQRRRRQRRNWPRCVPELWRLMCGQKGMMTPTKTLSEVVGNTWNNLEKDSPFFFGQMMNEIDKLGQKEQQQRHLFFGPMQTCWLC